MDILLLESEVITAVDQHINKFGQLDDDITCILEKVRTKDIKDDNLTPKQKRVQLFENEDVVLEQRGNKYYLSLYDNEGKFQREVTIDVKDNYKVGLCNSK